VTAIIDYSKRTKVGLQYAVTAEQIQSYTKNIFIGGILLRITEPFISELGGWSSTKCFFYVDKKSYHGCHF
jgi:hypothetical protein